VLTQTLLADLRTKTKEPASIVSRWVENIVPPTVADNLDLYDPLRRHRLSMESVAARQSREESRHHREDKKGSREQILVAANSGPREQMAANSGPSNGDGVPTVVVLSPPPRDIPARVVDEKNTPLPAPPEPEKFGSDMGGDIDVEELVAPPAASGEV
jgi:hypothetical protein